VWCGARKCWGDFLRFFSRRPARGAPDSQQRLGSLQTNKRCGPLRARAPTGVAAASFATCTTRRWGNPSSPVSSSRFPHGTSTGDRCTRDDCSGGRWQAFRASAEGSSRRAPVLASECPVIVKNYR
jgi:hypothetical protein